VQASWDPAGGGPDPGPSQETEWDFPRMETIRKIRKGQVR
jgi:hypothetical protein